MFILLIGLGNRKFVVGWLVENDVWVLLVRLMILLKV